MKKLVKQGFNKKDIVSFGNMFLLANGRYGYRGTLEEFRKSEMAGLNVLGFYDRYESKWRESINIPNPFYLLVRGEDKIYSVLEREPVKHEITLDIENAVFHRLTEFDDVIIETNRFVSNQNKDLLAEQIIITSKKKQELDMVMGLDSDIYEINGPHFIDKKFVFTGHEITFNGTTNEGKQIASHTLYEFEGEAKSLIKNGIYGYSIKRVFEAEEKLIINIYSIIDKKILKNPQKALILSDLKKDGFEKLLKNHISCFKNKWDTARVLIKGDEESQFEIDYSIYHLLVLEDEESYASVPARGLSGQTYKGAIFWDTELFMMPFYLLSNPRFARNTLVYRINTLGGALLKAKKYGYEGAFYAWESQEDGMEQCSDYNVTNPITHEPIRTYFAEKQIHISADVALAICKYASLTGDNSIYHDGGYEVIYECSKFYMSYSTKLEDGLYHFLDVIGPDEYHERVDDNAYTNYMIRATLDLAIKFFDEYKDTVKELTIGKDKLKEFMEKIYLPGPNDEGVIEQFKGYFDLEDCSPDEVKSRVKDSHEYLGGKDGVASKTKVIKQADVVTLLATIKLASFKNLLVQNYEYYLPYTEHGSSLSASMYSILAARINKLDDAYRMFRKSSGIDLGTNQKMYAGGIYIGGTHPASNAGAYLSIVSGFAGLTYENGHLYLNPHLPKEFDGLEFKFYFKNKIFKATINKDNTCVVKEVKKHD